MKCPWPHRASPGQKPMHSHRAELSDPEQEPLLEFGDSGVPLEGAVVGSEARRWQGEKRGGELKALTLNGAWAPAPQGPSPSPRVSHPG